MDQSLMDSNSQLPFALFENESYKMTWRTASNSTAYKMFVCLLWLLPYFDMLHELFRDNFTVFNNLSFSGSEEEAEGDMDTDDENWGD